MSILLFWIGLGIVFLIVEVATATFYGLALSLASAIVALYVWITWETYALTVIQWVIFAVASAIFSYFLPNYLKSSLPDTPQGTDRYIGEKRSVKKVWGDMKISLDWVDYLISSEDEIASGDKVEVTGHKGVSMKVKRVDSK